MAEYIERARLMEDLTASETQKRLKASTGGEVYAEALAMINNAPTIEAEPVKHGRWEKYECYCCVLVTGPYIEELRCEGLLYGSSNQEIHTRSWPVSWPKLC